MRQPLIILALAGAVVSPVSFAQSAQAPDSRVSTTDTDSPARDAAPVSRAHRAMASFNSLLREAALQSQAAQRASASKQPTHDVALPAPSASDDTRDALASTPDPAAIH